MHAHSCARTHTHTHAHTCTNIHIHTHTHIYTHKQADMCGVKLKGNRGVHCQSVLSLCSSIFLLSVSQPQAAYPCVVWPGAVAHARHLIWRFSPACHSPGVHLPPCVPHQRPQACLCHFLLHGLCHVWELLFFGWSVFACVSTCVCSSVCQLICVSVSLTLSVLARVPAFVCLCICYSVSLSVDWSVCLCLYTCLPVCLCSCSCISSLCISVILSVNWSVCLCLCACLPVCLCSCSSMCLYLLACWPVSWCVYSSVLTMEVEAVTYALHWIALRGDSQTTHAIILTDSMCLLQKVKSGMGSPDWNVSMVDIHLQKLLLVYCPGPAGVKGNDWADRLAGKATLTNDLLLESSEVLRSLRHYLWVQSQGHHTIDHLEERDVERGSARRSSLKGWKRAIVNQMNIGTVSKATLGKLLRDWVEHLDTILNCVPMQVCLFWLMCLHVSVCMSVSLSVGWSVCLCMSVLAHVSACICLCICWTVCRSVSVCLSVCVSVSVCLSVFAGPSTSLYHL